MNSKLLKNVGNQIVFNVSVLCIHFLTKIYSNIISVDTKN